MSTNYKNSSDVPPEVLADRLDELADVISSKRDRIDSEFTMRIPAECDRDADIVMAEAARRLRATRSSAEPVAYRYRYACPLDGSPIWRFKSGLWNGQNAKETQPLYTHPPAQDEAVVWKKKALDFMVELRAVLFDYGCDGADPADADVLHRLDSFINCGAALAQRGEV